MAIFEGQALQIAQAMASDVENIRKKADGAAVFVNVEIYQKSTEVIISERLKNGNYSDFIFEVVDGIAKIVERRIVDRKGRPVA